MFYFCLGFEQLNFSKLNKQFLLEKILENANEHKNEGNKLISSQIYSEACEEVNVLPNTLAPYSRDNYYQ